MIYNILNIQVILPFKEPIQWYNMNEKEEEKMSDRMKLTLKIAGTVCLMLLAYWALNITIVTYSFFTH